MTDLRDAGEVGTGALLDARYRLLERIGTGGMARVYRAEDDALQRTVAIKVLREPVDEDGSVERALTETTLLASLNHHSLVTLFDARISRQGTSYLVMEYVDGMTLRDLVARGPVGPAELASLTVDIAEGLHIAHAAGVVHRDVKPSNVLLWKSPLPGREWRAKVADFGIAYLLDSPRLTSPGMLIGTVAYIAPEQARGETPAPPADIYALGIMLIEALTGARPFADAEGIGSLIARLQSPPPIPDDLHPGWKGLLRGMTSTRPEDRPSALEVAVAAGRLAVELAVTPAGLDVPTAEVAVPTPLPVPAPELTAAGAAVAVPPVPPLPQRADRDATKPTVLLPAALLGVDGARRTSALHPASAAAASAAVTSSTATRAATAGAQRRRRRRIALAVGAGLAAVLLIGAIVAGIWSSSLASTPQPEPTAPTVVEPSVEPSVEPAEEPAVAPSEEAPVAPVTDDKSGSDNGKSGKGNGNSGPGNNSGGGKGKGKDK